MIKVAAALLIKNGRVLIAKRKANDLLANKWEFPGGKIEVGESPEECLRREIKEEFQVEIAVGNLFGESKYCYDHATVHLLAYWAYLERGELKPICHADYRWVNIDELDKYDFAPADKPIVEKLRTSRVIE